LPKAKKPSAPAKLPHINKLMALAIRLEHLLATGQVKDQVEIARVAGITRARVTQISNLTQLAPDIQALAFLVEISQLYHAPWIDAIRQTTLGGLVLGFGFLRTDLVCYSVGVMIGVIADLAIVARTRVSDEALNGES
jgi:hypothetical protein